MVELFYLFLKFYSFNDFLLSQLFQVLAHTDLSLLYYLPSFQISFKQLVCNFIVLIYNKISFQVCEFIQSTTKLILIINFNIIFINDFLSLCLIKSTHKIFFLVLTVWEVHRVRFLSIFGLLVLSVQSF